MKRTFIILAAIIVALFFITVAASSAPITPGAVTADTATPTATPTRTPVADNYPIIGDTYIDEDFGSTNFSSEYFIRVKNKTDYGARMMIKFNKNAFNVDSIELATLHLYRYNSPNSKNDWEIKIFNTLIDYDPSTVVGDDFWTGGSSCGTRVDCTNDLDFPNLSGLGWFEFDVTQLVRAWYDAGTGDYPILYAYEIPDSDNYWIEFKSTESDYAPYLTVKYIDSSTVTPTPTLTPTPTATTTPPTVTPTPTATGITPTSTPSPTPIPATATPVPPTVTPTSTSGVVETPATPNTPVPTPTMTPTPAPTKVLTINELNRDLSWYIYGHSDWIELYCTDECFIGGYKLILYKDTGEQKAAFNLPSVWLSGSSGNPPPSGFLAFDLDTVRFSQDTNFRVKDWELIVLYDDDGVEVDRLQVWGKSNVYRWPNGTVWYHSSQEASPGFSNYLAEDNK